MPCLNKDMAMWSSGIPNYKRKKQVNWPDLLHIAHSISSWAWV